jgi:hypothetical protein
MLAASSIGILMVSMLYVTFQRLRERVRGISELAQKVEGMHARWTDDALLTSCQGFFPMVQVAGKAFD